MLISRKFKQCNYILNEPFWNIFSDLKGETEFYHDFLLKTPPAIKKILFDKRNPYNLKTNLTPRDFRAITKLRNLTALAALLSLVKLHQQGFIFVSHITTLILEVMTLLTICSTREPLDLNSEEIYALVIRFMLGNTEFADKLLDTKTAPEHIKHLER